MSISSARLLQIVAFFCVLLSLSETNGAEFRVTPMLAAVLQPDLTPFPDGAHPGTTSLHGIPIAAQIDFFIEIADLQPGELGFGNTAFDVELRGTSQNSLAPGWQPDVTLIDLNGDLPLGLVSKWAENRDIGPSQTDLTSIYVGLFPRGFGPVGVDPRRTIGQAGPEYVGSVFVNWDGKKRAAVQPSFSLAGGFSTYDEQMMLAVNPGPTHFGVVEFGGGPESTSMQVLDWDLANWPADALLEREFAVGGTSIAFALRGDTSFAVTNVGDTPGPRISTHPGSDLPEERNLELALDWQDARELLTMTVEFSNEVSNVGFVIRSVDAGADQTFIDQVTIVGYFGDQEVMPLLDAGEANFVEGNMVTGLRPANASEGDVGVYFESAITRLELRYGNDTGAILDPEIQSIAIHDIRFTTTVPEPSTAVLAALGALLIACCIPTWRNNTTSARPMRA